MTDFRSSRSFEQRSMEASRIKEKYPDRVPIVCFKSSNCKDLPKLDKEKYLVPKDKTVGEFIHILRSKIELSSDKAIFLMIEGKFLPTVNSTFDELYKEHVADDQFLYMEYHGESTFGN